MDSLKKLDSDALARAWRGSQPFPHLVIDDFVSADRLEELRRAASQEPLIPQADEHFQFQGSSEPPASPLLRAFAEELGSPPMRETMRAITGLVSHSLSLRAYRYLRGDYLLPHTDSRPSERRVIAFAFYLGGNSPEPLLGGELVLYRCALEQIGAVDAIGSTPEELITSAIPEVAIASQPNRIALFAVSPATLHRVCEVTRGERLSLAGWFVA